MRAIVAYLVAACCLTANAFSGHIGRNHHLSLMGRGISSNVQVLASPQTEETDVEVVARRITVKGDVQGGYYRSCVLNEVSTRN